MPFGRGGMGYALFLYGEFLVFGGETDRFASDAWVSQGDGVYRQVSMYNPVSKRWTEGPPLPVPVHGIFPVFHETSSSVFVAGGGVVAAYSQSTHLQILSVAGTPPPTAQGYIYDYRINCGGPTVSDAEGNIWTSDAAFNPGGHTIAPSDWNDVQLIPSDSTAAYGSVLQTERYTNLATGELVYRLDTLTSGRYRLQLVFIEVWHRRPGTRVFRVSVQGEVVQSELDVVSLAGFENPLIQEHYVTMVSSGQIEVRLSALVTSPEGPALYAIALSHLPGQTDAPTTLAPNTPMPSMVPTTKAPTGFSATTLVRINCGGPAFTDSAGNVWTSDSGFHPGGHSVTPSDWTTVSLSPSEYTNKYQTVLDTERWTSSSIGDLVYNVPVSNAGTYEVVLLFAEMWHPRVGERVFHIAIQGQRVQTSFDIFSEAGYQTPLVKKFLVTVDSAGDIVIVLEPILGSPQGPAIYAVEIATAEPLTEQPTTIPTVAPSETPTKSPTVSAPTVPTMQPTEHPTTAQPTSDPTTAAPTQNPTTFQAASIVRINCGGPTIVDTAGNTWHDDGAFNPGGSVVRVSDWNTVSLPSNALTLSYGTLLETERWAYPSGKGVEYTIAVPSVGHYKIQMLFAEMWHPQIGARVFNVDILGERWLSNLDVYSESGYQNPILKEIVVVVTASTLASGGIQIHLSGEGVSQHGPAVYSIALWTAAPPTAAPIGAPTNVPTTLPSASPSVLQPTPPTSSPTFSPTSTPTTFPTSSPTTLSPTYTPTSFPTSIPTTLSPTSTPTSFVSKYLLRINCGGPTVTDSAGFTWISDSSLQPGGHSVKPTDWTTVSLAPGPLSTTLGSVFETERWTSNSAGVLRYSFAVSSTGFYNVELVFAEMWHPRVGARVFHVDVNGERVLPSLDIFAQSGYQTPMVKALTVHLDSVLSGSSQIVIELVPIANSPQGPAVYAIALSTARPPTQAPTHVPTTTPSVYPTDFPTLIPTFFPTRTPSVSAPTAPTHSPTHGPSSAPTTSPTGVPTTTRPTSQPSLAPTVRPTTATPTATPTRFNPEYLIRLNCGGPTVTDSLGVSWETDSSLAPGGFSVRPTDWTTVSLSPGDLTQRYSNSVLETERWTRKSAGSLVYTLPVASDGFYRLELMFAEMWHDRVGARVFHVNVNGVRKITNLDIFAKVGLQTPMSMEVVFDVVGDTANVVLELEPTESPEGPAVYSIALSTAPPPTAQPTQIPTEAPNDSPTTFAPTAMPTAATPTAATASPTSPPTIHPGTLLLEENCLAVCEVESTSADDWAFRSAAAGHSGSGYLQWTGQNAFLSRDAGKYGLLTYTMHLSRSGNYRIAIRNFHDDPDSTESNDCWLKVGEYAWVKVYSELVNMWQWMTKMDVGHGDTERPPIYYLEAGHHTLLISGRSHGFAIDRIHVYDESCVNLHDATNPFILPSTLAPVAPTTQSPTTTAPTDTPTHVPTSSAPSLQPTIVTMTHAPTMTPSGAPSTLAPTTQPTNLPTETPSRAPTLSPTVTPTALQIGLEFPEGRIPAAVVAGATRIEAVVLVTNTGPVAQVLKVSFKIGTGNGARLIGSATIQIPARSPQHEVHINVPLSESTTLGSVYRFLFYLTPNGTWSSKIASKVVNVLSVDKTDAPTHTPTVMPTTVPTYFPSSQPTVSPSTNPTKGPTNSPTDIPTLSPTTSMPSSAPTAKPTWMPTNSPTRAPSMGPTYEPVTVLYRVNCGGPTVLDVLGNTWTADSSRNPGGSVVNPSDYTSVVLADVPAAAEYGAVFLTERWTNTGRGSIKYDFDMPTAGIYRVSLLFVEVWHRNPGTRVFNVKAQNNVVLENFDIVSEVGFQTPVVKDVLVTVEGTNLSLEFVPLSGVSEGPAVYAIAIATVGPSTPSPTYVPTESTTTLAPTSAPTLEQNSVDFQWISVARVNCGTPQNVSSVIDLLGAEWHDESEYLVSSGASGTAETSAHITFNDALSMYEELFYFERYGDLLEYVVPVPMEGRYQVAIFLSENWHRSPGARLFSMSLQGHLVKSGVDIVSTSGWQTATVLTAETYVSKEDANLLRIELFRDPQSMNNVGVFAIEVSLAIDTSEGVLRLNSGGETVLDALGNVWKSDELLSPGGRKVTPSLYTNVGGIPDTSNAVYSSVIHAERWTREGFGDIVYNLEAPRAGQYILQVLTMEVWHPAEGAREFDILVQGLPVFTKVDPRGLAGFQKPVLKESMVHVEAAGTTIEVRMRPGSKSEGPAIYGVALFHLQPVAQGPSLEPSIYGDPWQTSGYTDPDGLEPSCLDPRPIGLETQGVPYNITWQAGATEPIDYREAQGLSYGGKLWVFGGFESDANLPDEGEDGPIRWVTQGRRTLSYDPATNKWEHHSSIDIPGGVTHCGQAVIDNLIILAGGLFMADGDEWPNARSISTVFVYNPIEDVWGRLAPLPDQRGAGALVTLGRRLHFFGGGRFEPYKFFVQDYSTHWYYDFDDLHPTWKVLAPLRDARNHIGGAAHGGKLYAIGGQHLELEYTDNRATVEMYDPCTNRWTFVAGLPEPRGHISPSVISFREGIIVVGGAKNGPVHYGNQLTDPRKFDAVLFYEPVSDQWTELQAKPVGAASQVTGVVTRDGVTQILNQRWNGSWVGTISWELIS